MESPELREPANLRRLGRLPVLVRVPEHRARNAGRRHRRRRVEGPDRLQAPRDPEALSLATRQGRRVEGRPPAEEGDRRLRGDDAFAEDVRSFDLTTPVEGHAAVVRNTLHRERSLGEQHAHESKKKCEPPVPLRRAYHTYR